ncbi:hypothetical protein HF086_002014 [Spodoptera exigua]|uniref:HTH psq-type domain-containing protein n=1 Tax=Spodoptera exigua TaxID=7107 RepID=A0A922ML19_SPOEX|nr:hypothetical protein HF086_002014 [Spodoptera exigua]
MSPCVQFPLEEEYKKKTRITREDIKKFRDWVETQPHLPAEHITDIKMSPRKKRGESWSEDDLKAALRAVKKGKLSQRAISLKYNIPRRTLRDHMKTGQDVKRMGRKPILTEAQENDLCGRIKSSSSDNSDIASIWPNLKSQVMIEEDRDSPSLIPDTNLIGISQFDSSHYNGDKHLGQHDLAVPSCSGLQKSLRDDPGSDSTISDLDSFVQSKYVADHIYNYTSDESSRDGSQCHLNKGTKTPKKQMICPIQNETCNLDEDNVPLASLQQENKTQFQQFLPTPNYAKNKSSKPRKKAMNYKGQRITKDLFNDKTETKKSNKQNYSSMKKTKKEQKSYTFLKHKRRMTKEKKK